MRSYGYEDPLGPLVPLGPMGHLDLLMLDDLLLLMIASIGQLTLFLLTSLFSKNSK